jgi:hypothetical protein
LQVTIKSEIGFYIVAPRSPRNAEQVGRMRDWLISQSRSDGDATVT